MLSVMNKTKGQMNYMLSLETFFIKFISGMVRLCVKHIIETGFPVGVIFLTFKKKT